MEVTMYDEAEDAEDESGERKRPAEASDGEEQNRKRVKFDSSVKAENPVEEERMSESAASESHSEAEGVARLPPERQVGKSDE